MDKVFGVVSCEWVFIVLLENCGLFIFVDFCELVEYVFEMIWVDWLLIGFWCDSGGVCVVVDEFGGFVGVIGVELVLVVLVGWWCKLVV